jgi:hypothetical protein
MANRFLRAYIPINILIIRLQRISIHLKQHYFVVKILYYTKINHNLAFDL